MIDLTVKKTCSCGREHTIGGFSQYKVTDVGVWADCVCKSTMLFPAKKCFTQKKK